MVYIIFLAIFFVCDMILKMFISQQLIQLQLKKDKDTDYVLSLKSKAI